MPQFSQNDLRWWPLVLAYLVVAPAAWYVARRLLPPQRWRAVPWTGLEILACLLLGVLLGSLFHGLLMDTRLGVWLCGRELIDAAKAEANMTGWRPASERVGLRRNALSFPFEVLAILCLVRAVSGTRPHQLGLTTHQAGRNALLGALAWVILTPLVQAVYYLVTWALWKLDPRSVSEHSFSELAQKAGVTGGELALIVFLAMVVAPVREELFFRGLLQPWLARRWWGGHVAMGLALLGCLLFSIDGLRRADGWVERFRALSPALFVVALLPGFAWVCLRQKTPFGSALYGTSVLFAVVHSAAWPQPVPLFVLALGLGWLAHRTQSLIGPIVLHSLFNGVGCVQLVVMRQGLA